jgi:YhcH/YjgK/YiaL family protein
MFAAHLSDESAWRPVVTHPALVRSLAWVAAHAGSAAPGDYPLDAHGWYANVHGCRTRPAAECVWESHSRTIDIQYVIDGEEGIRLPARLLGAPARVFGDQDRLEYAAPEETFSLLTLRAGMFSVFVADEGHCPMLAMTAPMEIRKAVVKVPMQLLAADGLAAMREENGQ